MKKTWNKPKLLVLARSTNPEDVLTLCKGGSALGDPNNNYMECMQTAAPCDACSTLGDS